MNKIFYIILIALLVLSAPVAYRNYKMGKTVPGQEFYQHQQIAASEHNFSLYGCLLKAADILRIDIKIVSIILGVLSCVFLYLFLVKIGLNKKTSVYSLAIFALSPAFIYIFSTISSEILPLFLIILGAYLLANKKTAYFSIIPFVLAIENVFTVLLIIFILASYFLWKKEKRKGFFIISGLILAYSIFNMFFISSNFFINYEHANITLLGQLFSDIGGHYGISIFAAIFAAAGFFSVKKRIYLYPLAAMLFTSFFINYETIIYSNILISCLAGFGIEKIVKKKWKLSMLKEIMTYMLACGVLLSAISQVNLIALAEPSPAIIKSCDWISNNTNENSVILSKEDISYFIAYFGKRNVFYNPSLRQSISFPALENGSKTIFYSRSLNVTENLLKKYSIKYILINDAMRKEIWKEPDEGLLFLFTNEEKFSKVYDNESVQIWNYRG